MQAINPVTKLDTPMLGEPAMRGLQPDDMIQIERKGFVRCDAAFIDEARPGKLFLVPDGKVKGLFGLADRVAGVAGAAGVASGGAATAAAPASAAAAAPKK